MRALVLLSLFACEGDRYQANDLQLLTSYAAKELCTCLFVMERDEDYCAAVTKASPNLKTYRIDWEGKRVETQAVLFWGARAHFAGRRRGCIAD